MDNNEFYKLFERKIKDKFVKGFEQDIINKKNRIGRISVNNFTISTTFADDIQKYETAIIKNNIVYIVEYYLFEKEAQLGHDLWINKIKECDYISILNLDDNKEYTLKNT